MKTFLVILLVICILVILKFVVNILDDFIAISLLSKYGYSEELMHQLSFILNHNKENLYNYMIMSNNINEYQRQYQPWINKIESKVNNIIVDVSEDRKEEIRQYLYVLFS